MKFVKRIVIYLAGLFPVALADVLAIPLGYLEGYPSFSERFCSFPELFRESFVCV